MPEKRWRYTREQRLREAPAFIAAYTGKSILQGYRRWFRVARKTAIIELTECGVVLSDEILALKDVPEERPKGKKDKQRFWHNWEKYYSEFDDPDTRIVSYSLHKTTWEEIDDSDYVPLQLRSQSSTQAKLDAIRVETVIERDGRIEIPDLRAGDSVEIIVIFRRRADLDPPGMDKYDPFADD